MQFMRRFGAPMLTIGILIGLSVLAVVSMGEGFKLFVIRRDGVKLRRRDGSTITFTMPWNPPKVASTRPEANDVNPAIGPMLNAVEAAASALLDDGTIIANNVQSQASILTATVPVKSSISSTVLIGGASQVPALAKVTSEVNQATSVVAGIVNAADSIVGGMVAGAVNTSNAGILSTSGLHLTKSASSTAEPQEFLPQTALCTTCNSSHLHTTLALDITSAPLLSSTLKSVLPMAPSYTPAPTCTSCPAPLTETCTVTETWHSTHYADTATLYSFIAAFTVTCTETVRFSCACPSPNLYLTPANTALPMQPSIIVCANGVLAKRQEDCPPIGTLTNASAPSSYTAGSQTSSHPCPNAGYSCSECPDGWFCPPSQTAPQSAPCGFGWACGACSGGWFCIPNPTSTGDLGAMNSVAGILSSVSMSLTQVSPQTMASFTFRLPSLASTGPITPVTVAGLSGGGSSGLQAFGALAGTALSQVTGAVNSDDSGATALTSAPSQSDPPGASLGSVISNMGSTISTNTLAGLHPTTAPVIGNAGNLLSNIDSLAGNVVPQATADVNTLVGNIVATGVSIAGNAASAVNVLDGTLIPTVAGSLVNGAGLVGTTTGNVNGFENSIAPTATAVLGNVVGNAVPGLVKEVKQGDDTISHISTVVNGHSTVLPIVITILNGHPTAVPVVNMMINGAPTNLPVLNAAPGRLARLLGRFGPKSKDSKTVTYASYEEWLEEARENGNLA